MVIVYTSRWPSTNCPTFSFDVHTLGATTEYDSACPIQVYTSSYDTPTGPAILSFNFFRLPKVTFTTDDDTYQLIIDLGNAMSIASNVLQWDGIGLCYISDQLTIECTSCLGNEGFLRVQKLMSPSQFLFDALAHWSGCHSCGLLPFHIIPNFVIVCPVEPRGHLETCDT